MVEISCQPYGPCMFSSTMSFAPRSSLLGLFILVRQSVELLCMKNYDPHSQEQSSFYVLFNISPMGEKKRDKRFGYQAFLSVYVQYHNFRNLWTWCFKSSATNDYSTLSKLIIHILCLDGYYLKKKLYPDIPKYNSAFANKFTCTMWMYIRHECKYDKMLLKCYLAIDQDYFTHRCCLCDISRKVK